jgi:hypothetical protein
MTLDNGVYIVGLTGRDQKLLYYVAHAHAIENIFTSWITLWQFLDSAVIWSTKVDAWNYASTLDAQLGGCENEPYYICTFESYTLDQIVCKKTEEHNVHHLF